MTIPVGNRLPRTLRADEVGLFVVSAEEQSTTQDHGTNVALHNEKSFTTIISHLSSFSQYIIELQACQVSSFRFA